MFIPQFKYPTDKEHRLCSLSLANFNWKKVSKNSAACPSWLDRRWPDNWNPNHALSQSSFSKYSGRSVQHNCFRSVSEMYSPGLKRHVQFCLDHNQSCNQLHNNRTIINSIKICIIYHSCKA